jgi:hypothetical protein
MANALGEIIAPSKISSKKFNARQSCEGAEENKPLKHRSLAAVLQRMIARQFRFASLQLCVFALKIKIFMRRRL